jgi:hypothetical protein
VGVAAGDDRHAVTRHPIETLRDLLARGQTRSPLFDSFEALDEIARQRAAAEKGAAEKVPGTSQVHTTK